MTYDIEDREATVADHRAAAESWADYKIRCEHEAATRYGTNVYALRLEMQRNPAWDEEAAGQAIAKRRQEAAQADEILRLVMLWGAAVGLVFFLWATWGHW